MSNQIAEIQGFRPDVVQPKLFVTSFYGGIDEGRSIQVTFPFGINYVQLTRRAVWELHTTLGEWLREGDDTKGS